TSVVPAANSSGWTGSKRGKAAAPCRTAASTAARGSHDPPIMLASVLRQRLAEAEHVAFAIADRELFHVVGLLHQRPVDNVGAARPQFVVQRARVADPEERVPRTSLPLVRTDLCRLGDAPEHHRQAVAAEDRELRRRAGGVVAAEPEHLLVLRRRLLDVSDGKYGAWRSSLGDCGVLIIHLYFIWDDPVVLPRDR